MPIGRAQSQTMAAPSPTPLPPWTSSATSRTSMTSMTQRRRRSGRSTDSDIAVHAQGRPCHGCGAARMTLMRLLDLSHVIEHQMITCPGLPGPEIGEHLSFDASAGRYAAGTEFAIGQLSMVVNTGTYLDTPAHRFRDGHDLAGLPLERCVLLPAVVVDGDGAIDSTAFSDICLLYTSPSPRD